MIYLSEIRKLVLKVTTSHRRTVQQNLFLSSNKIHSRFLANQHSSRIIDRIRCNAVPYRDVHLTLAHRQSDVTRSYFVCYGVSAIFTGFGGVLQWNASATETD